MSLWLMNVVELRKHVRIDGIAWSRGLVMKMFARQPVECSDLFVGPHHIITT